MDCKIILFFHVFNNFLQSRISEFFHFSTYLAHNMFMLPVIIRTFELCDVIPELMLDH